MPHVYFVWTLSDIFGAIVFVLLATFGILFGALFLVESAMRKFKHWWSGK